MKRATTGTNRFYSASLGCLLVLLIVVGSACRKQEDSTPEPAGPEPNATSQLQTPTPNEPSDATVAPTPTEPAPVAVTVNGDAITEANVQERMDYYMRRSPQMANLPPAFMTQIRAQMRPRVLETLISQSLLKQQVEAADIEVTDEEVSAVLAQRGAAQNPPMTVEQLKQLVESQGGNFGQLKEQFKEGIALEKFMEGKMAGKMDVTEEQARTFYEENPEKFDEPEQVRASHILIRFADAADPNADPNDVKAAAKARTQALLAEIKAGGNFAELAQANSMDPGSASRGGDLDFFPRGKMVPPFEEAAFSLEPNAVSDIVETQHGYHIIKATGHKDARTVSFEEAKANIIAQLKQDKQTAFVQEYLQSLKAEADIVYPPGSAPSASMPAPTSAAPPTEPTVAPEDSAEPAEPNTN